MVKRSVQARGVCQSPWCEVAWRRRDSRAYLHVVMTSGFAVAATRFIVLNPCSLGPADFYVRRSKIDEILVTEANFGQDGVMRQLQ